MVIISDDLKGTKSNLFAAETGFEKKVLIINKLMKSQKKSSNLPAYFPQRYNIGVSTNNLTLPSLSLLWFFIASNNSGRS